MLIYPQLRRPSPGTGFAKMDSMIRLGRFFVAVSLVASAACQGGTGSGTPLPDANANAVGDAAISDDLKLTCNADDSVFPTFSRSCQDATECAIATHQIDCCGSTIATGIVKADLAAFEQAESDCQPLFPGCGCASLPPVLDDGTMALDIGAIGVGCSAEGFCVTFSLEQPGDGL